MIRRIEEPKTETTELYVWISKNDPETIVVGYEDGKRADMLGPTFATLYTAHIDAMRDCFGSGHQILKELQQLIPGDAPQLFYNQLEMA